MDGDAPCARRRHPQRACRARGEALRPMSLVSLSLSLSLSLSISSSRSQSPTPDPSLDLELSPRGGRRLAPLLATRRDATCALHRGHCGPAEGRHALHGGTLGGARTTLRARGTPAACLILTYSYDYLLHATTLAILPILSPLTLRGVPGCRARRRPLRPARALVPGRADQRARRPLPNRRPARSLTHLCE